MGENQQRTQAARRALRIGTCVAVVGALLGSSAADAAARPAHAKVRVVGGAAAQPGSWPSVARIVTDEGGGVLHLCTGTLVAPNVVLTAGHCVVDDGGTPIPATGFTVETGSVRSDDGSAQQHVVSGVQTHPSFDSRTLRADVALLVLEGSASSPTMPYATDAAAPGTRAAVAGWGLTAGGSTDVPSTLQAATTSVQADDLCGGAFSGFDPATMLCAADAPSFAAGACNGDSGGPLVVQRNGGWVQVGVTSWGPRTCDPHLPGAYVRVSAVAGWIADRIAANPPRAAAPPRTPADDAPATPGGARGSRDDSTSAGQSPDADDVYRGRTAQGRAIVVRLGAAGRTVAAVRFDHRTSCRGSWQTFDSGATRLARRARRGLAAIGSDSSFAVTGATNSGQRFRLTGRFSSARRLTGTLRVSGSRTARRCGDRNVTYSATRR